MIYNAKISVPLYKMIYAIMFMVFFVLVRGIGSVEEIGHVLDSAISLLSIIFCADTYYQEIRENRWEVFQMLPRRNSFKTICQRLFIQCVFLIVMVMLGYWLYYIRPIGMQDGGSHILAYLFAIFACSSSILFFGTLSFTFVNLLKNFWAGVGCCVVLWFVLISTIGARLPDVINIFSYSKGGENLSTLTGDWMIAKFIGLLAIPVLLYLNYYLQNWKRKG